MGVGAEEGGRGLCFQQPTRHSYCWLKGGGGGGGGGGLNRRTFTGQVQRIGTMISHSILSPCLLKLDLGRKQKQRGVEQYLYTQQLTTRLCRPVGQNWMLESSENREEWNNNYIRSS